ncbi:MAG: hypothetical protein V1723_04650 [Candidatus Uhrbacteria bacterium]
MENQNIPMFPFDALDAEEVGSTDIFPPVAPSSSRSALAALRKKLEELEQQVRTLLLMVDHELQTSTNGLPVKAPSVVAGTHPSSLAVAVDDWAYSAERTTNNMYERQLDPIPSGLHQDDHDTVRVIEGVFDGQNMVGPDGKQYSVPANYASKSKLVEGDILKLRITARGAFVYKQIGPIARERRIGVLERDDLTGEYIVIVPDSESERSEIVRASIQHEPLPLVDYKRYRILRSSIAFYRGAPGDEVVVLVPQGTPSTWAAVENVIKR